MTDTLSPVDQERGAKAPRSVGAGNLLVKVVLVGLLDALLVLAIASSANQKWWLAVGFFVILLVAVNVTYFVKGPATLPVKYLLPGLAFLAVFQLYTMGYTAFASFTNYGTGHLGSKDDAITAIQQQSVVPVTNSPNYAVVPVVKGGTVSMLITDPATGKVSLGTNDGLADVNASDEIKTGSVVTGLNGYTSLNLATLTQNAAYNKQWNALRPPIDKAKGIYLRQLSVTQARQAQSGYTYSSKNDTLTSITDGTVFKADAKDGSFVNAKGTRLSPGWRVGVGLANFKSLFGDKTIRTHFLPILVWTFVFAILTTLLNFTLGLFLALIMNDRRMRGQGIYRLLLIVPFGLPGILTALTWKGMLNTNFGLVNQFLGADIPWLTDPWVAKFSILMVNLWMGFPYFFLVCSGALTAIPADLKEAAFVDGASARHAFRTVVLPLLLVATAPLLVTTFAFNFNNFTLIQVLTAGGPFSGTYNDGGSTDLLITYTFRTAFNNAQQQLGLASAIALVIFVIVGSFSAYGFRLTRKLEEIGR